MPNASKKALTPHGAESCTCCIQEFAVHSSTEQGQVICPELHSRRMRNKSLSKTAKPLSLPTERNPTLRSQCEDLSSASTDCYKLELPSSSHLPSSSLPPQNGYNGSQVTPAAYLSSPLDTCSSFPEKDLQITSASLQAHISLKAPSRAVHPHPQQSALSLSPALPRQRWLPGQRLASPHTSSSSGTQPSFCPHTKNLLLGSGGSLNAS